MFEKVPTVLELNVFYYLERTKSSRFFKYKTYEVRQLRFSFTKIYKWPPLCYFHHYLF